MKRIDNSSKGAWNDYLYFYNFLPSESLKEKNDIEKLIYSFKINANFTEDDKVIIEMTFNDPDNKLKTNLSFLFTNRKKINPTIHFALFSIALLILILNTSSYIDYFMCFLSLLSSYTYYNNIIDSELICGIILSIIAYKLKHHYFNSIPIIFLCMTKQWDPLSIYFLLFADHFSNFFYISGSILSLFNFLICFHPISILLILFLFVISKKRQNIYVYIELFLIIVIAFCFYFMLFNIEIDYHHIKEGQQTYFNITLEKWYHENNTNILGTLPEEIANDIKNQKPLSFIECESCDFNSVTGREPASTERDIIIIQASGSPNRTLLPIQMLRQAGCRARIFIVLSKTDIITQTYSTFYKKCGVSIYTFDFPPDPKHYFVYSMRQLLFAYVLPLTRGYVDRCFYFDVFDTVFQGDPFKNITNRTILYYSSEEQQVNENYFAAVWLHRLPGFHFLEVFNETVICSGLYGGYADVIEKFSQLQASLYHKNNFYTLDQAAFDFIIYCHILERAGIHPETNPDYLSIGVQQETFFGEYPGKYYYSQYNIKPAVIHQINRVFEAFNGSYVSCGYPPLPPKYY